MAEIIVKEFFYRTSNTDSGDPVVEVYADGNFIKRQVYSKVIYNLNSAKEEMKQNVESFGILGEGNSNYYKLQEVETPPAPQPTVEEPIPTQEQYYVPKANIKKPKIAKEGEFIEVKSQKPYTGEYVETSRKQFFSGNTVSGTSVELQRIKNTTGKSLINTGIRLSIPLLLQLLNSFFKRSLKPEETNKPTVNRYFVKDIRTGKIVETSEEIATQVEGYVPGKIVQKVEWTISGPFEDQEHRGRPLKGVITKNREATQKLEKVFPGIEKYIGGKFTFLATPFIPGNMTSESSKTGIVEDPLGTFRKANFDKK